MNINTEPLVSIVIPCYNHEYFIQECIQSVIDQDYKNIELIIIDDGSPDDSVRKIEEMIPKCKERFVRFEFRHRSNKGLCATLNEGLTWAQGVYFSPSASDDIILPEKISQQIHHLIKEQHDVIGVFTGINIMDRNKKIISTKGNNKKIRFNDILLRTQLMPGQAVMLQTDKVLSVGGYDENIAIEDLDLFLRLGKEGYSFSSISTPLVNYRKHDNNMSGNHLLMIKAIKEILEKYKNNPLYTQALSNSIMIEAHGIQASNKKISWGYMWDAIKIYPANILSKSFLKYLIKSIIR